MLGNKPACADANSPHNLAAATAEMMWACALATTRITVASTARSLELWSRMLHTPAAAPNWAPAAAPAIEHSMEHAAPSEPAAAVTAPVPDAEAATAAAPGESSSEPSPFASYRSAGGHAAAQVTVSN